MLPFSRIGISYYYYLYFVVGMFMLFITPLTMKMERMFGIFPPDCQLIFFLAHLKKAPLLSLAWPVVYWPSVCSAVVHISVISRTIIGPWCDKTCLRRFETTNRIMAWVYVRSITRSTMYQKAPILLAGTGVWKFSSVACGFSSIKIDYSDIWKVCSAE